MALLHKPTALLLISCGMDDRYSAKTRTGTNQVLQDIHISARNARLILCFHVGTGKNVYIVFVWFTSAEFYGFGKRVERKQKGPLTACVVCHVCDEAATSLSAELPPCTSEPRVSREHRQSCTHTQRDTVHLNRHWRHFRRRLQYLQKTLT